MGGTEILLVNLLNHLIDENQQVTLLLPQPSDDNILLERVSSKVKIEYIFPNGNKGLKKLLYKNILIFYPRLYKRLIKFDESQYDLIICFKDCFHSILFSRLSKPTYLWIQNHPHPFSYISKSFKESVAFKWNRLQLKRMKNSFDIFDKVICVSDTSKREYIRLYNKGIQKREILVLYNALDLSGIEKRSEEHIELPQFIGLTFIIVIRLSYEKTVERAIIAADKLIKEGYNFRIHILGDGSEYNNLQNLVNEKHLGSTISMFGRVANPFPYMRQSDWLLCPSSRESFSLVLLEAISLNTPVITTACGGPEDVVANGKYGIITENSEDGVYSGMKTVLDNPTLQEKYNSTKTENLNRFNYAHWLSSVDSILNITSNK